MSEKIALMKRKLAGVGKSKHGELSEEVEMAVGMKVMVTENLENGPRYHEWVQGRNCCHYAELEGTSVAKYSDSNFATLTVLHPRQA